MIQEDSYQPQPLDGVECVKVEGLGGQCHFVLVHPRDGRIMRLDLKDHFVWTSLGDSVSIADIKQKYYQQYKVLPTQRIAELVRLWYECGYLQHDDPVKLAQPETTKLRWGVRLPLLPIRLLLGPFTCWMSTQAFSWLMSFITIILIAIPMVMEGPLFPLRAMDALEPPHWLGLMLSGAYLSGLLTVLLRIGSLWLGTTYRKDFLLIGGWFVFPALYVSERGFELKSIRHENACRLVECFLPLLVAGAAANLALFVFVDFANVLFAVALGAMVKFIAETCPFWRGSSIKLLESSLGRQSIQELREAKSSCALSFEQEFGHLGIKGLERYTMLILAWVVMGCSYLLVTFSMIAGELGRWGAHVLSLGEQSSLVWQWLLYGPLILFFFWMFWKLLEPFIEEVVHWSLWQEKRLFAPLISALVLLLVILDGLMPILLQRAAVLFIVFALWLKSTWTKDKSLLLRWWGKVAPLLIITVLCSLFLPKISTHGTWIWAGFWLAWTLAVTWSFSPKSPLWLGRVFGTATVMMVAIVVIAGSSPSQPMFLFAMASGLWFGLWIWSMGGQMGCQHIGGLLSSLCFLLCMEMPNQAEAFAGTGLILAFLPVMGWGSALDRARRCFAEAMTVDVENPERSLMETIGRVGSRLNGNWAWLDLKASNRTVKKKLSALEAWFGGFASEEDWRCLFRVGLSSCRWTDRIEMNQNSAVDVLSRIEKKQLVDIEARVRLLRSQMCFKGFKAQELVFLADFLEVEEFSEGAALYAQGEPRVPSLDILLEGSVTLEKSLPGGRVSTLSELGRSEAINMENFFRDGTWDFSVYGKTSGVMLKLYRHQLMAWGAEHPERLSKVMASVQLSETIMKLSLFKDFSSSQVRLVMEKLKQRHYAAGEDVIVQGEEGDEFYLLDRGGVDILVGGHQVAQLGQGSYFGEIALLEKCKRTATVRTNVPSVLYVLQKQDFEKFFASGRGAKVLRGVSSARGGEAS